MMSIVRILLITFTFIATNTLQPTSFIHFASLACLVAPIGPPCNGYHIARENMELLKS
jgi:hypothetical protein